MASSGEKLNLSLDCGHFVNGPYDLKRFHGFAHLTV